MSTINVICLPYSVLKKSCSSQCEQEQDFFKIIRSIKCFLFAFFDEALKTAFCSKIVYLVFSQNQPSIKTY